MPPQTWLTVGRRSLSYITNIQYQVTSISLYNQNIESIKNFIPYRAIILSSPSNSIHILIAFECVLSVFSTTCTVTFPLQHWKHSRKRQLQDWSLDLDRRAGNEGVFIVLRWKVQGGQEAWGSWGGWGNPPSLALVFQPIKVFTGVLLLKPSLYKGEKKQNIKSMLIKYGTCRTPGREW